MSQLYTLVVGASRGLGRALVEELDERGCDGVGLSRHAPEGDYPFLWAYWDADDASALPIEVIESKRVFDAVVFCHAIHGDKSGAQWDLSQMQHYMQINCYSVVKVITMLTARFKLADNARIVVCGSALEQGSPNQPAYAMSKAALATYIRSLAMDTLAGSDLSYNIFWPGRVNTDANPKRLLPEGDRNQFREPHEVAPILADMLDWRNGPSGQTLDMGR